MSQMHDHNVEASLISAAISEAVFLDEILDVTSADAFHGRNNRIAFECITDLKDRQHAINMVTVCDEIKKRGVNMDVEIATYLTDHPAFTQDPRAQANILQAYADRRQIQEAGLEMMRMASDLSEDVLDIREASEKLIFALRRSGSISSVRDTASVVASILTQYTDAQELARNGNVTGVPSGIRDIDKLTLGWQPSKLIILAARPSVGKTGLAIGFAFDAKVPTLIFSMEMDAEELVERRMMPDAGVSTYKAKSGHLKDADWQSINAAGDALARNGKVYVDDRPGLTIQQIKSTARRMKIKHDIGLLVVDYLQLAYGSGGNKNTNREQDVASISRGMKELAKELKIPVIGLSQLNRTKKHDERPDLRDLRESGSIEQDADIVMFLWRDPDINGERNAILNWCVDKHRGGALGGGKLVYVPNSAKIVPYYEDEQREKYGGKLPF
jgi:replicative DNA helicase